MLSTRYEQQRGTHAPHPSWLLDFPVTRIIVNRRGVVCRIFPPVKNHYCVVNESCFVYVMRKVVTKILAKIDEIGVGVRVFIPVLHNSAPRCFLNHRVFREHQSVTSRLTIITGFFILSSPATGHPSPQKTITGWHSRSYRLTHCRRVNSDKTRCSL